MEVKVLNNIENTFVECWKKVIAQFRLRSRENVFFSESDIHHALISSLEKEKVKQIHVEFPLPLDPSDLWKQIERFGQVTYGKDYYRADVCVFDEEKMTPELVAEVRWIPALIPPFQFLPSKDEKTLRAIEKLTQNRKRYDKAIPNWYSKKLLRNLDKFLNILNIYAEMSGFFCVLDECCPSIDKQLPEKIKGFDIPDNFHLCVDYVK